VSRGAKEAVLGAVESLVVLEHVRESIAGTRACDLEDCDTSAGVRMRKLKNSKIIKFSSCPYTIRGYVILKSTEIKLIKSSLGGLGKSGWGMRGSGGSGSETRWIPM
jgi:hypothetical protein